LQVEKGTFVISSLDDVAACSDELRQLARIFQAMVQQVKVREEKLKQQVEELRIKIDQAKQERQVAEKAQKTQKKPRRELLEPISVTLGD
jgi:phage shock protein A